MKWIKVNKCALCGSENIKFYRHGFLGVFIAAPKIEHYVCECGLIFQNPRPDDESIKWFYSSGEYINSQIKFYSRYFYRVDLNKRPIARAKRIVNYVPVGSHLDVGCGRGHLLRLTKEKGCKVLGVEPFEGKTFKDIPTVRTIEEVKGKFDTVSCIDVLEHVSDPNKLVKELIKHTGKRLIIEVPDWHRVGRMPHLWYYTKDVIIKMFDKLELVEMPECPNSCFIFERKQNVSQT